MSDIAAASAVTDKPSNWLRAYLIVIAVLECLGGLSRFAVLFSNDPDVPGPGWGGWAVRTELGLTLPFALAALFLLIRSDYRRAIPFIAGIGLLKWISLLPSLVNHPADFPGAGFIAIDMVFRVAVVPLLAAMVFTLCWKNERLTLAGVLAGLHAVMQWLGVVLFAIGIAIYGF